MRLREVERLDTLLLRTLEAGIRAALAVTPGARADVPLLTTVLGLTLTPGVAGHNFHDRNPRLPPPGAALWPDLPLMESALFAGVIQSLLCR